VEFAADLFDFFVAAGFVMPDSKIDQDLREEFNRWADSGKGETMEHEHWPIAKPVLGLMQILPNDNIFDVGCGAGWLSRILAKRVPEGRVVGMDISDEMIRHARQASTGFVNLGFVVGGVGEIPWESDFFTRAISVESSYYWPDPAQSLREIHRVLCKSGSAWVLINYYRDNPFCHQWGKLLAVPTHLLSAEEWSKLFRDAGFKDVGHRLIPDPTPNPEVYNGRWFRDAKELAEFRAIGALLIYGAK
jgi:SAM-dependent methyltransferase